MNVELTRLETVYVDRLPLKHDMEEEILYMSNNKTQATHLCPNCGREILTPFGRGGYHAIENSDESITLSEPIEHCECNHPYKIYKGFVIWS